MKISELSECSGVTIASIKFYLREGLLFQGIPSSPTQSAYEERHLARLRLIRALIDVGGLSVATARDVIAAIDNDDMPIVYAFGIAQHAVTASLASSVAPSAAASKQIHLLKNERGWETFETNPGEVIAARVLDAFGALGRSDLIEMLPTYADAAERVARADLSAVIAAQSDGRTAMVETVVIGTTLGDNLFAGLRRVAQEHVARQLGLPGALLETPAHRLPSH